ncbi:MAG: polyhydroxyalkanoate depolymerase [Rhodospirillales bacterium]|nr:polyhydroxyalkanoate depolymerase [Rhodospirillales bacterium]USO07526.1 MAG: polyhydroxyalkanoate depolymerase [Rhodospirillales bacterium]
MLYHLYDLYHASMTPARATAEMIRTTLQNPFVPMSYTLAGRTMAASAELFERATRKFGRPEFGLGSTTIDGRNVEVMEEDVIVKPFCTLMHFRRRIKRRDPKVLVVAPISGHFATLLRGTVEALLPHHDVYITDWEDARQVPLAAGRFNLDDYIAYVLEFIRHLGPDVHVIAVCQPAVPVFVSACLMNKWKDAKAPRSIILMGGPIDPRVSKTAVTELAEQRPLKWFEQTVTTDVPFYYPGAHRRVYPGFLQLGGFMSMNLDRHIGSHLKFFQHLVQSDGESADAHRRFYNEYLAVMDLPGEFYLQTVEIVFQKHLLPKRQMKWKDPEDGRLHDVDPHDITHTAILTIEGELDDISARGQTEAAHGLTPNLPAAKHYHHLQAQVGHYGIFNGRKWREQIMPRVRHFIRAQDRSVDKIPAADLDVIPDLRAEHWQSAAPKSPKPKSAKPKTTKPRKRR